MKKLDKYISKRFWLFFFVAVLAFVLIFLIVDIVENLDHYIDHKANWKDVVMYYIYYLPFIFVLVFPMGALISANFLGGSLVKHLEIIAIRGAGISAKRIIATILFWGFLLSIASFIIGEFLIPMTNQVREKIKRERIDKRRDYVDILHDVFYTGSDGAIFYFRTFNPRTGGGNDIVIFRFKPDGSFERTDAKTITYNNGKWILHDVYIRKFTSKTEMAERHNSLELIIPETPRDFARKIPRPDEMGFIQLAKYVRKLESSGVPARREKTDLWMKIAYPLVNLIVLLIGFTISIRGGVGSYIVGFGQSFFIAFLYLASLRAGQALGYNGTLHPVLAAFIGDIIFGVLGLAIFIGMRE